MDSGKITVLLKGIGDGNEDARSELIEVLYDELRSMASRVGAKQSDTLSPTVLVHDAYLRLMDRDSSFRDRFHFLSTISVVMRNLLIDYARSKKTAKRGGSIMKVSLTDQDQSSSDMHDLGKLTDALELLEKINPRQARFLQLKYFGGLTLKEIGEGVGVSQATVHNELKTAEAWLYLRLKR